MSKTFARRGGQIVGRFSAPEASALRQVVGEVVTLLDERAGARGRAEPVDPLAVMVGLDTAPRTRPEDPALARLLPDGYRDDPEAAAELRSLTESSLREGKLGRASTVLDQLPSGGGEVLLDHDDATAWLSAFNDVRLALGTRMNITEDVDPEREIRADPTSDRAQALILYSWLTWSQETLVEALQAAR